MLISEQEKSGKVERRKDMQTMTSAYANKMLKSLEEDKAFWLNKEEEACTYVEAINEEPVVPDYDYVEVATTIAALDEKIAIIKHELNVTNANAKVLVGDVTMSIDKRGKPMMSYQWEKRFQHVVEKYNRIYRVQLPKITPHVCRHTFCTNAAKRGISVETLKYLMGHTDISVTSNVYTHLKLEDAQREMERLERIEKEMKKCAK